MKVGLPKEIKDNEYRVGLTPAGVQALAHAGHEVYVQKTAGEGSGFTDEQYVKAGGQLLDTADDVWKTGDMIVKVKEPIAPEYPRIEDMAVPLSVVTEELHPAARCADRPVSQSDMGQCLARAQRIEDGHPPARGFRLRYLSVRR